MATKLTAKDFVEIGLVLIGIPSLGGATACGAAKLAVRYGNHLTQFGPKNLKLIATIGVIQNLVSMFLIMVYGSSKRNELKETAICHIFVAGILLGLTALAARINLISARLTLAGTGMLIATGILGTMCITKISDWLDKP